MLIGELSKQSGLSRDTIRFYEKMGLIRVMPKERRRNNYKEYSEGTLERLLQIKRVKSFGFTLNEAADFLEMIASNQASCEKVAEKMTEKIAQLDEKIMGLIEVRQIMLTSVNKCQQQCSPHSSDNCCPMLLTDF